MSRAAQLQALAKVPVLLKNVDDFLPHGNACHGVCIADDVHAMLRSRKGNVDPVGGLEKSSVVGWIAAAPVR